MELPQKKSRTQRARSRIGIAGRILGCSLGILALTGCSGGLFPAPVNTEVAPQACGSGGPRVAPYFTASPTRGVAPLSVTFSSSGADVTEWLWSFGDGSTSSLPSPTHTYAVAGSYTVHLTVTRPGGDGSGGTKTESLQRKRYILVSGAPDLTISELSHVPDTAVPGTTVTFSVTVANLGTASAGNSYVVISSGKTRVLAYVPALGPGVSATVTAAIKSSQTPETFTVKADGTSRVRESNETNNTVSHVVSSIP